MNSSGSVMQTPIELNHSVYADMCGQIIKHQGQIIGVPLALEQASHVNGLTVDPVTYACTVKGDGSPIVNDLVEEYRDFFGHAAVEVCKEATSQFMSQLPEEETPSLLK